MAVSPVSDLRTDLIAYGFRDTQAEHPHVAFHMEMNVESRGALLVWRGTGEDAFAIRWTISEYEDDVQIGRYRDPAKALLAVDYTIDFLNHLKALDSVPDTPVTGWRFTE